MTRYVYNGSEIAHLFAADSSVYAYNSSRTVKAGSGVLWSYAQPIAAWVAGHLLISKDFFSMTIHKHQRWANYALQHIPSIQVTDLKFIVSNNGEKMLCEYIAKRVADIEAIRAKMGQMRGEWKKTQALREIADLESACVFVWNIKLGKSGDWQNALKLKAKVDKVESIRRFTNSRNRLESGLENAQRMIANARVQIENDAAQGRRHGLQAFWILDQTVSDIRRIDEMSARNGLGIGGSATFHHAAKLMGKKWAKECQTLAMALCDYADSFRDEIAALRAAYDKAESLADADRLALWIGGESNFAPRGEVVCRVVGDTVETSKGARVPLTDALQVVDLARACRESGKAIDLRNRRVGNYLANKIDANGNLTIGCHYITWEAIADCLARFEMESV